MAIVSTNLPALMLELAEQATTKEATLNPVQERLAVTYDREGRTVSITASFPATFAVVAGKLQLTATNYTADPSLDLVGSPIAASGATNYASALMVTAIELSNAENAIQAAGGTLPTGAGTLFTFTSNGDIFSFTADMPIAASQNAQGQTVLSAVDYLD
ncbi:hypothetical protein ACKFKF_19385 [Phormidesmis sp. 146-12]